jgi:hypothetical protein
MKRNKIFIIIVSSIVILFTSLASYYFGAYSFYNKIFLFSAPKKVTEKNDFLKTAYRMIQLKSYNAPNYSKYGGIDFLFNKLIYVEGDGTVYFFEKNLNDKFVFKKIKSEKIPNNRNNFIKKYQKKYGNARMTNYFGVRDIYIDKFDSFENELLILSSLDYDIENDCHRLAVFSNQFIKLSHPELAKWKKIFVSKKCLEEDVHIDEKFPLSSAGGRIVKFDENHILLSVGDYAVDGYYSSEKFSQDLSNDYGKIIKININDLSNEIFSYGHRNPQGLFFVDQENIFSTEHGPYGGDELNIIYKNKNYGWPVATFGTAYNNYSGNLSSDELIDASFEWPNEITSNSHDGFQKPIFSWGPRWGVSNLIVYKSGVIDKRWAGNFFISSLRAKTLTRMVFNKDNKSIIYAENILIDKRIRDIVESPDGKIVLLTDQEGGVDGYNEIPQIIFISKINK